MHEFVDSQELQVNNLTDSNYSTEINATTAEDEEEATQQQPTSDKCWKGYSNYPYMWIITGPMTLALFVSTNVNSN